MQQIVRGEEEKKKKKTLQRTVINPLTENSAMGLSYHLTFPFQNLDFDIVSLSLWWWVKLCFCHSAWCTMEIGEQRHCPTFLTFDSLIRDGWDHLTQYTHRQ